jgi:type II secretory pathway component PulF
LTDAFQPGAEILPPFYLPVVNAGEESGRLVEAFEYLERHCKLLNGPAATLRNLWFYPVVILLAGSIIRVLMYLVSGSILDAISTFFTELFGWLQLVLIVAIVMLSPARYFIDRLRLSVPLIGELEREIALHRFFRVMTLVYSVGGHRVEVMIQTAAATVGNRAARIDLLKAADAIEQHATISGAFRQVPLLTEQERTSIEAAETSGTLEQCFDRISDETGASMVAKLNYVQPILVRIVMALVVFSLLTTLLSLAI